LAQPGRDYTPTITPNNVSLPWKIVDGAKVYHLIAEEVKHEFAPGLEAFGWGFNGRVHGPTIEAVEGDRVRIYVTNKLPAATSIHWHGIILPNGMDGISGLTQPPIKPGETFKYEFTLRQHGTHMYHSHHDEMTQMALGLMGLFIIHPRQPKYRVDRDFAFMLSEWRIDVGTMRPNPNEMTDFNVFSMNARIFPGTQPMVAKLGDRVRIRFVNLSAMDHHPMHLHGHTFRVVETDGGQIPESAQQIETTVLVQVGSARVIEFVADNPGDWPVHCHMTHHTMTQMGDKFPNTIGVKPGKLDEKIRASLLPGYMTMGESGMADMGTMGMPVPRNSLPMMGGPARPYLVERVVEVAWSSDGARMVYHTDAPGDPMFVADRTGVGAKQLFVDPIVGGHNHHQAWSPDGRWIYFARGIQDIGQMDLWRIAASGGQPERLTYHNAYVGFPTPIDDRNVLYIAKDHDGSGPWLWALDTGSRATRRVAYGTEQYLTLAGSADHRRLVASVANPSASLWTVPIRDRPAEDGDEKPMSLPTARALAASCSVASPGPTTAT